MQLRETILLDENEYVQIEITGEPEGTNVPTTLTIFRRGDSGKLVIIKTYYYLPFRDAVIMAFGKDIDTNKLYSKFDFCKIVSYLKNHPNLSMLCDANGKVGAYDKEYNTYTFISSNLFDFFDNIEHWYNNENLY